MALSYRCDVADRDAVLALAARVKEEVGDVSILVNNAGIMPCHPLVQHNPQEIRKIFDINVLAHFWVSLE
jgi:NAD(P)-dependent dehydrogenase (short-subunit alcohol dehydrogenase family)